MNKQQIIDLWRISFDDSEEFIHFYFENVFKEENTLVIENKGHVVSALQMLPYKMTFCGTEISIAYISGACTLPSERGKGWMKLLLHQAFKDMVKNNIAVTTLIPAESWLFNYYSQIGYSTVFDYSIKTHNRNIHYQKPDNIYITQIETAITEKIYLYFSQKEHERECSVLHSPKDFENIYQEWMLENGTLLTTYSDKKQINGLAFIQPDSGKNIFIRELFADDPSIENYIIQAAIKINNVQQAIQRTLADPIHSIPTGMARIIDTDLLIQLWLSTHHTNSLSFQDFKKMDTETLTQFLFNYSNKQAYMNLMLD